MSDDKVKILMVCLGNICRSPLAQGILENKLDPQSFLVASAGTASYHIGKQPDERSINIAKQNGINIKNQRAAQFKKIDFEIYDHIFVMDTSNYENVISLADSELHKQKVQLILNEIHPKSNSEVPDPYYGGNEGFKHVYNLLDEACENLKNRL